MKKYTFECTYCGETWGSDDPQWKCISCRDENLRYKDNSKTKIDYYAGSPPFPEDKDHDPWNGSGD
jgi:hypothetical protein